MRRYKSKKSYSWNTEVAYIAGLIASDGCLYNDGRHINITSKDTDLLEIVRAILRLKGKYKSKISGYGKIGFYLQFSDVSLYDFLLKAGITPAKSKTIKQVKIPSSYYGDFLRGYFDGDGFTYGYRDSRWKNSFMYYTGFVSASPDFIEWLRKTNTVLAGTTDGKIKDNNRAQTLLYAKRDSQHLYRLMYHARGLPCLHRKKVKIIDYLRTDPYASKELFARVAELVDATA